ncbi:flagellin lysine-N-methylase [Coprococcus eutactus]|uniref:flagellin lysine-N-methylase n=1 Tax=Coprococcus eutactus TaxID=33043 RepID=UPI00031C7197|nr:flagellin lysine-N-methylase [Coprococcus eutactus]UEA79104.1 flagellin lysine-N-methylase [Coprococcus eutactus ATCC 27759]UWP16509.1 flagellin lysine-N-methylase [Coprococcus eutactus]
MIYTYPDYYKKFNCIADKCPDTCCGKWQIVIDDDSLEKYEDYNGEYRDELRRKVNWKEGVFRHGRSGKCAFLRDDMLCDMYIHMGKESLCTTCREYPRHTEEFENVREVSLSLSCPEVARILMNITDKVTFVTEEDDEDEVFDDFDYFLYSNLEDIREAILNVIQDRSVNIRNRIERVIQIGASAQRHYDEGDLVMWDETDEQDKPQIHGDHEEYMLLQKQAMFLIEDLELLYDDWEDVLIESQELLFGGGEETFTENRRLFEAWWRSNCEVTGCHLGQKSDIAESVVTEDNVIEGEHRMTMDIFLEQIIVYFISIYLLGAVYDDNISGKVNACVGHAVELYMLLMARWLRNGETLSADDLIELSYRYSREIEHSDENLEQVEVLDWFGL